MKRFTRQDLKTGHIVKLRNGQKAILTGDSFKDCILEHTAFIYEYNDDLIEEEYGLSAYDIVEVYDFKDKKGIKECLSIIYDNDNFLDELKEKGFIELIWKRENEEKREIDWTKVPKWTKVLVKGRFWDRWKRAYFLGIDERGCKTTFYDEFIYAGDEAYMYWYETKLFDENDIKEEWYK